MSLAPGTRLGAYEIVRMIGAGGMGEVYRARDTNLGRDVALKILPDQFTSDADRLARFKREAQVLASLNHPNIAHIYGVESSALVMELVEGDDLSALLERGPLSSAEALAIAKQIADALEAAHEQSIVHRDLKPANIKIRSDGVVKVLDFGLAKPAEAANPSETALMHSPTMTVRGTQMGVIVGTAAYMSPEQAAGKPVDRRCDLWALGVVLLEMLTGKRTFDGETVSHVLAAVLKDDPDLSALPTDTPESIRTLLRRCLEKDRRKRLDSAAAARLEIEEAMAAPRLPVPAPSASTRLRRVGAVVLPWLAAAVGMTGVWMFATRSAPAPVAATTRSFIDLPDGLTLRSRQRAVALSPDGSRLAVVLRDPSDVPHLYIRMLDKLDLHLLPGTDEASEPFWSPDGRSLGFFTARELKRIDLPEGPVRTIAAIEQGRGASWGSGDRAIFSALAPGSRSILTLYDVSMGGGGAATPIAAVRPSESVQARLPTILPAAAGTLFLSSSAPPAGSLHLLDRSGRVRSIAEINSEVHYVPPGWLAFVRNGMLMVQPFDLTTQTLSGTAQILADDVAFDDARVVGQASFSSSPATRLVYQRAIQVPMKQLTWLDAQGRTLGTLGQPAQFDGRVVTSPDGRRGIVAIHSRDGSNAQLWMVDLATGLRSPFTADSTVGSDAVWSPDGRKAAYRRVPGNFVVRDVDGPESAATVQQTGIDAWIPESWTPDGLGIFAGIYRSPRGLDIGIVAADGKSAPKILIDSPAQEQAPKISPDGRWLAYISDESGQNQVYVTAYPAIGAKWPLTNMGVQDFTWNGSNTVVCRGGANAPVYSVSFRSAGGGVEVTDRQPMFGGRPISADGLPTYSASLKRFLVSIAVPGQRSDSRLVLVTDWQSELKR